MRPARPILFSGPMVRALLAGTKTQTRRVLKGFDEAQCTGAAAGYQHETRWSAKDGWHCGTCGNGVRGPRHDFTGLPCPYGAPGDLLIMREAHYLTDDGDNETVVYAVDNDAARTHLAQIDQLARQYPGDHWAAHKKQRPSIHMHRWASRLTLEITEVRVERLNRITTTDAQAEGWDGSDLPLGWYADLWEQINGAGSWDANPWVWAVSFKVHHQNVDAFLARAA